MSDDEIKEQKLELHKIEGELSVIEHEDVDKENFNFERWRARIMPYVVGDR